MNDQSKKTVVVLVTGLFPDGDTLAAALGNSSAAEVKRHEIDVENMDDAAWDRLLGALLGADNILTL